MLRPSLVGLIVSIIRVGLWHQPRWWHSTSKSALVLVKPGSGMTEEVNEGAVLRGGAYFLLIPSGGFCKTLVSRLFGSRDQFHGRQYFHGLVGVGRRGVGHGFGMIQVHSISYAPPDLSGGGAQV